MPQFQDQVHNPAVGVLRACLQPVALTVGRQLVDLFCACGGWLNYLVPCRHTNPMPGAAALAY